MKKKSYFGGLKNAVYKQGLGLALGAGGLKGFFHVGVLKLIDEAQIPVKIIAGSSAGSLAGALYASGLTALEIEDICMSLNVSSLITLGNPTLSRQGILQAKGIIKLLENSLKKTDFSQLKIPFYAVTTDLLSGEKVVFSKGSVATAVRASISIPAVFEPVIYENRVLVDGALKEYVPMTVVREHWNGPLAASWLTPPVHKPIVELKSFKNPLNHFSDYIPFLKNWPLFDQPDIKHIKGDMLSIMFRSWDIIADDRQRTDFERMPPDILFRIDPEFDPGLTDLNSKKIAGLIRHGYDNAVRVFKELKLL